VAQDKAILLEGLNLFKYSQEQNEESSEKLNH
jgi:hypothetical protein